MPLKPRSTEPKYNSAGKDFQLLEQRQKEYSEEFLNHLIYPVNNYVLEKHHIMNDWKNREVTSATDTMEADLQNLDIAYNQVKDKEVAARVLIKGLFRKLYSYYEEMLTDFDIGYLDDHRFEHYLNQYRSAIEQNKQLKLTCWNLSGVTKIEKMIALILKKK